MGENVGKLNKLKMIGRKRRIILAAVAVLAVGLGAWAVWRHLTKPEEITLDLGNNVKMRLVLIPAGKFMMGSPATEGYRRSDETQHEVILSKPFFMGVYEVTQEQYEQVMGVNPSHLKGATNPVDQVSWDDAIEFCKQLSQNARKTVTLPTEAQWEYACRAGTTTPFNTGNALRPDQANFYVSSSKPNPGVWEKLTDCIAAFFPKKVRPWGPTPVGTFSSNAFGLYDVHGNVCEWCSDWHGKDYYSNSPTIDPQGPATGQYRVVRGGSWAGGPGSCRSAGRGGDQADIHRKFFGFRVVVLPGSD